MKKNDAIHLIKVLVLCDLLIQYTDELGDNKKIKEQLGGVVKFLEPMADLVYNFDYIQKKNTVQVIQNKIDTIFRHELKNIEIK